MTDKPPGHLEVRPNTLRDQTAPNTFRQKVMPGAVGRRDFNSGGGNAAPPRRIAGPQLPRGCSLPLASWQSSWSCTC